MYNVLCLILLVQSRIYRNFRPKFLPFTSSSPPALVNLLPSSSALFVTIPERMREGVKKTGFWSFLQKDVFMFFSFLTFYCLKIYLFWLSFGFLKLIFGGFSVFWATPRRRPLWLQKYQIIFAFFQRIIPTKMIRRFLISAPENCKKFVVCPKVAWKMCYFCRFPNFSSCD